MQLGLENDIVTSVHCEGTVDRLKPHNVLRAVVPLSVVVLLLFVFPANGASKSPFGKTIREQVGVNIHFTAGQPGEMDELRDAGFGFVRMDFSWGDTEKQSGVYDFFPISIIAISGLSGFSTMGITCTIRAAIRWASPHERHSPNGPPPL
jgi:hypothetical protein